MLRSDAEVTTLAYRGPDRRGVIRKLDRSVSGPQAVSMIVGIVAIPIVLAIVASETGASSGPWSTGVADAAFVGYSISAALLLLRWRILGDAACLSLASAVAVVGLFFVPSATRPVAMAAGLAAALRAVSVVTVVFLSLRTLFGPEVRAELRPARSFVGALLTTLAVGLLLGLSPARVVFELTVGGIRFFDLAAAIVTLALSGVALRQGVRLCRLRPVGLAAILLSISAASAANAANAPVAWQSLSALFLCVGAVEFVAIVGTGVASAINAVVIHDVRGRRRWEAAEAELTEVHSRFRVQRHDVESMLSAIDGTLLVLATQREELAERDTDRLLGAVREEVHLLRANLNGQSNDDRPYDLADLIATVVSVRDSRQSKVYCEFEPGIELRGRPDRIAVAVDNLLANATIHAPRARVTVRTRYITAEDAVEISVSDNGPGLSESDVSHAFERGWRADDAAHRPGSGLGLGQCRELVGAEGGDVELGPTDPFADPGEKGLTVRITFPISPPTVSERRASRQVQMRVIDGGVAV
jgi:signal transduction histidine kinase